MSFLATLRASLMSIIAAISRRRRGGGGGAPVPPVVDHVVVTPSSFSLTTGATQQLAAQSFDPSNNPIADTFTWGSSNAGQATVSGTGLVTGVTAGSPTITATSVTTPAKSGTSAATVTSGGTVTSITLWYNGQDVSTYGGMLLFTGTTYAMTAKDQTGTTLANASGNWSSTDGANAPVGAGTGIVAPNGGIAGGSITFTHTASMVVGTALFSVLKTPAAVVDQRGTPANTTALMAQINSSLSVDPSFNGGTPVPTGGGGSLYTDGVRVNHFAIDSTTPSRQFMGGSSMLMTISAAGGTGEMLTGTYGTFYRCFGLQLIRFEPGFTMHGAGNQSFARAFKVGNWADFVPGGRVGAEMTNGDTGTIDFGCGLQDSGGVVVGGNTTQTTGNISTEFTAGETWVSLMMYEVRGGNIMSGRMGWFKIGSVPNLLFGGIVVEGPMTGGNAPTFAPPKPFQYRPTTVNYNQTPPFTDLYVSHPIWQLVNGDTYGDPYGVLGSNPTQTLTGISGGTVNQGATSASITLTGTNFNINCHPVFSNAGVYPQSITINSSTTMTVVVAVSPSATTGAGTVAVNNQANQVTTSTQVVTVNGAGYTLTSATPNSLAPGATSQNIALVGTGFASGNNAIFSNAGITVNSTTFNSSTSLTANISVSGGATQGAGTVLVRNASPADTNTVTFTVALSPSLTDLKRRYVASAGTNTTTNGASITTWTDQVTGTVQLTSALTGITYVSSALNGKPGIACNGVTNNNLQESAYDAAINTADTTVVVIGQRSGGSGFVGILNLSGSNRGVGIESSGAGAIDAYTGSGSGFTSIGAYAMGAGYHTLMLTANHSTPAEVLYADNVSQATGATAYAANTSAVLTLFGYGSSGTPFQGTIVEVLIYGHDLNSTERTNLASYINAAYGI